MTAAWSPTPEHRSDVVTARAAGDLHDLLDREPLRPVAGDELPILWHWLAFLPQAEQAQLGPDGHPRTGMFLPPRPRHGRTRNLLGWSALHDRNR